MENNETLKNILNDLLSAYAQRDRNVPFQDWLGDALREKLPELSAEDGAALAEGIIGAINGFNQKLCEVDAAPESGLSKEGWLEKQLVEGCAALPPDEAGKRLLEMENGLIRSNVTILSLDGIQSQEVPVAVADPAGWNEDTLEKKAREIAEQVGMAGLGIAANAAKYKMDGDGSLKLREVVGDALQDGVTDDPEEVKAIVASAIKAAAEKGLVNGLDKDTPVGVFGDMAGFVVEGAQALFGAVNGDVLPEEAAEKVCKAGIAVYACCYSEMLKGLIVYEFPVVGPVAVELLGGLFDHMKSPQFADNVYTVLHDMAVATWEGIKQRIPTTLEQVAELADRLFTPSEEIRLKEAQPT